MTKINKAELQKALEIVKPGLANKELIEQTTSFAFFDTKVVTYNDSISIAHPVKGLEIVGAIHADALFRFLNKTKAEEINIELTDNEIRINAGKSKVGLVLEQKVKLPLEEINVKSKWHKLPDEFMTALSFVHFSAGTDMSKARMTAIHVRKDGIIESSDGKRLTQFEILEMPIDSFLLPATSAQILQNYKPTHIRHSKGWVHFKTAEGTIFSSRILEDTFPDTSGILECKGKQINFPKKMESILEKASIFAKSINAIDENSVYINIVDGMMECSAKNETGWFKESARVKWEGKEITFCVNPDFLQDILKKMDKCIIGKDIKKIKFTGEGWLHVCMLIEMKG